MRQGVIVSTVQTAAATYDLIDLATLKTLLGVTDPATDGAFKLWISHASRQAQNFMNQPIVVETISDQIWPRRDGIPWAVQPDLNTLQLSRWPVVSVASVTETVAGVATALVAGTDYLLDAALGRLYRLDQNGAPKRWTVEPVAVVYQAGWAAVPLDIVSAVADLVKIKWLGQTRDPMIREENIAGVQQTSYWFGAGPSSTNGIPPNIADQLDNYRMPVIE